MDFTKTVYNFFLDTFKSKNYTFFTFKSYLSNPSIKSCILLRHDVDRLPNNALQMAELEHSLDIKGSYYFRVVPESFDIEIMKKIEELGHEIGYHYEDVDLVLQRQKIKVKSKKDRDKLIDLAYDSFCKNLEKMREVADIKTICMHGSPLSKFDNKIIWDKYDYKNLGLIAEPYYDINFNEFAYFTDTGRRDRKSTRLNSSHTDISRMPSSA